eukprot:TRINITY_DN13787_c0_g1_i2.p1 TRINITY_DN13787_c0_g1~~TRINITY_DN13787_c0_g1_i2.p1  ORF type:complete len:135 (+),score=4.96 TRINITY_DN13787_c0_g1_i2:487-891(+)
MSLSKYIPNINKYVRMYVYVYGLCYKHVDLFVCNFQTVITTKKCQSTCRKKNLQFPSSNSQSIAISVCSPFIHIHTNRKIGKKVIWLTLQHVTTSTHFSKIYSSLCSSFVNSLGFYLICKHHLNSQPPPAISAS